MRAEERVKSQAMSASQRKRDRAFKANVAPTALRSDATVPEVADHFRVHPPSDLHLEEGAHKVGAHCLRRASGCRPDEVSERKLAELWEKVVRLMVERDFFGYAGQSCGTEACDERTPRPLSLSRQC
jgi:hypothetical protein